MKRIRVLFTIPNFNTAGSGKALLNLALGLNKKHFDAHIACKSAEGSFFEIVKNSAIPVHIFDYEAPMRPVWKLFSAGWKASRKLKQIAPDIIHSFHYNNNYGEAIAAKLVGKKWVFTKKNMNWGSDGANAWKLRSALADTIIIQNAAMKSRFYPNTKKTVLVPRGINVANFAPGEPDLSLRAQMNTPDSGRIIIAVANMVPIKGLTFLIDAFAKLETEFQSWHLWLIGDDQTTYGQELHQRVSALQLDDKIHFSGKQINVLAYLQHAELYVLPTISVGEGSPVSLLEAMANVKVTIGSNVSGIADVLAPWPELLFPPENSERIALRLRSFMQQTTEANRVFGNILKAHVETNFSIEKEVLAHESIYMNVVGRKEFQSLSLV